MSRIYINKINVLGCEIKIEYFKDDGRNPNLGQCNPFKNLIQLCEDSNEDTQHQTLLHEILHKIDDDLDLDISEHKIAALSAVLYSVLKENKGVLQ